MKLSKNILTSYWFLISLLLLLLNDFILKETFHNWFTGKLSDFAGVIVFVLFWQAIFPKYKLHIYLLSSLLFFLWKSPFSGRFIYWWNETLWFSISRVIDYSDCLALLTLPLLYRSQFEATKPIKLNPAVPFVIASFAFMATSYENTYVEPKTNHYYFDFGIATLDSSLQHLKHITFSSYRNDTTNHNEVYLYISDDFCSCYVDVSLGATIIERGDSSSSEIEVINFFHTCTCDINFEDATLDTNTLFTQIFESKVIDPLREIEKK